MIVRNEFKQVKQKRSCLEKSINKFVKGVGKLSPNAEKAKRISNHSEVKIVCIILCSFMQDCVGFI